MIWRYSLPQLHIFHLRIKLLKCNSFCWKQRTSRHLWLRIHFNHLCVAIFLLRELRRCRCLFAHRRKPRGVRVQLYHPSADVGGTQEAAEFLCQEVRGVRSAVFAAPLGWKQTRDEGRGAVRSVSRTRTEPWRVSGSGFMARRGERSEPGGGNVRELLCAGRESPASVSAALTGGATSSVVI